jgi:proteic killer suppression protein
LTTDSLQLTLDLRSVKHGDDRDVSPQRVAAAVRGRRLARVNPQQVGKIENILGLLDVAESIEDMNVPSFLLHLLTGDLKGFWAVTVRGNWRIVFRFADGRASDVDLVDYH